MFFELAGIAATLRDASLARTPATRHVVGVAQILAGAPRVALANLSGAATATDDARVWNDYAAALYETARRQDAPDLLADALAAADRSLALDATLAEARFNRALFLERLGLNDDARAGWESYLAADDASPWAAEASEHLSRLLPPPPFLQALDRASDDAAIQALVRRWPQQARTTGEKEVLGRWATEVMKRDNEAAGRHLHVAQVLGDELARFNGDRMLQRAVASIDGADWSGRNFLAAAQAAYDRGLTLFENNRPADAAPELIRAGADFLRGGSPMALPARFFAANTSFEQGRHEEARRLLEQLLVEASGDDGGFRAQLLRQIGACHATQARWGDALQVLRKSATIFDRLGETQNAAGVRRIIAVIHDRTGDPGDAWRYRMAALRGVGQQSNLALEKAVSSIAWAAVLGHKWRTAASFLTLEIDIARRIHDDVQLADALLARAAVRNQLRDAAGARADLADAAMATERSADASYREYGRASQLVVRAMLATSPPETVALLTEAIAFQSAKGDRMNLPGLYLQRGRALRQSGDVRGAAADFERGMSQVEADRASLPDGEARWGAFFGTEELFEDAIDLALEEHDAARALSISERSRARGLLESLRRLPLFDPARLPAGTVVVEYVALPSRLVTLTSDRSGVTAVTSACTRDQLVSEVDAAATAFQSDKLAVARQAAAALFRRLVDPVADRLTGASTVVFVPDPTTATVPFAALVDARGSYFIERQPVVVAPSVAAFVAAVERRAAARPPTSVAIVGNPEPGGGGGRLTFVSAEAEQISRHYPHVMAIDHDASQFNALAAAAPKADVLHFAGHAVGDDSGFAPASLVLREGGQERHVGPGEIAQLRLKPTAIVVLAGCNTARGERRASEGVISVTHGFLIAGASSVVATLWPIEDQGASELFPRLHRLLARGIPAAEALRTIQLDSIRRGNVALSLWAGLQDIGS